MYLFTPTGSAAITERLLIDALKQAAFMMDPEERTGLRSVSLYFTAHRFWLMRSEETLLEAWSTLRSKAPLFYAIMQAHHRFATQMDLEFGLGSYQALEESVIERSSGFHYRAGGAAVGPTLTDAEYQADFQAMSPDAYMVTMKASGWFVFLLIVEFMGIDWLAFNAAPAEAKPGGRG
jgi:hypothetical protein